MSRRDFLAGALSVAISSLPGLAAAQPARRARLGWLSGGPEGQTEGSSDILKQTLQELGWKLGETHLRWTSGGLGAMLPDCRSLLRRSLPVAPTQSPALVELRQE